MHPVVKGDVSWHAAATGEQLNTSSLYFTAPTERWHVLPGICSLCTCLTWLLRMTVNSQRTLFGLEPLHI